MKIKKIVENIESLDLNELENYAFKNIQELGLFLLEILLLRFRKKNEIEVAKLISKLLITEITHWEGKDIFEIYFYQSVLEKYPNSEIFLESILSFCLPPYTDKLKHYIEVEKYKTKLEEINPESLLLKKIVI